MMSIRKLVKASLVTGACCAALNIQVSSAIVITETEDTELLANTFIVPNTGITLIDFSLSGSIFEPTENGYVFDDPNSAEDSQSNANLDRNNETDIEEQGITGIPTELNGLTDIEDGIALSDGNLESTSSSSFGAPTEAGGAQTAVFNDGNGLFGLPSATGIAFRLGGIGGANANLNNVGESGSGIIVSQVSPTSPSSEDPSGAQSIITGEEARFEPSRVSISFDADDDVYAISFVSVIVDETPSTPISASLIDSLTVIVNGETIEGISETPAVPVENPIMPVEPPSSDTEEEAESETTEPVVVSRVRFDIPVEPDGEGDVITIIVEDNENVEEPVTILLSSLEVTDHTETASETAEEPVPGLGETEFTPVLPDPENPTNEEGDFVIVLPEVEAFETIFIDPDVATGYTFTVDSTDPTNPGLFASVTAPSTAVVDDPDGFTLTYIDENGVEQTRDLASAETFVFPVPVETFSITGIDPSLGLDPTQSGLFTTGVSFESDAPAETLTVIQSPLLQFISNQIRLQTLASQSQASIPEPGNLALMTLSLFGALLYRRRLSRK
jgi:hypothetical protein